MYGGLFGDLPAAKNKAKTGEGGVASPVVSTTSAIASSAAGSEIPHVYLHPAAQSAKKPSASPSMLPRFIPTQAFRPRQQQAERKRRLPSDSNRVAAIHVHGEDPLSVPVATPNAILGTVMEASVQIPNQIGYGENQDEIPTWRDAASDVVVADPDLHVYPLQETEQLRMLHERAKEDLYDPLVPNDLLQYWEQKVLAVEREKLMLQREETIREQEQLRLQLEQERMQLEKQGDVNKIVEHRMQRSIGRGRGGVSNLPAWLVEKQKNQQQQQQQQPNPPSLN